MSNAASSRKSNEELARQINLEARANPQSPYAGKFVGIANGQVVVVADNWDELGRRMEQLPFDRSEMFCVEASGDYDTVQHIWYCGCPV
jgi:hypothetical protein